MQSAEATYDGIALEERVGSGEASSYIDAEIAPAHESAEVCLGDMVAADAVVRFRRLMLTGSLIIP